MAASRPSRLAGLVLPILAIIAVLAYRSGSEISESESTGVFSRDPTIPSIVILPFRSLSGTESEEAFALGITEDLITDLSNIEDIRVAPLLAVISVREHKIDLASMADRFQSRFALDGSVRIVEGRVRISAQLIDLDTMGQIWAERFDKEVLRDAFFEVQDDITRRIVSALQMRLTTQEEERIEKQPTSIIDAYDYYTMGKKYYWQRSREQNDRAIEMFWKAIEKDPEYALACAALANCYTRRYDRGWDPDSRWIERALDLSKKAVMLDPDLPEAYHAKALAMLAIKDYTEAIELDRQAIRLRPNYFDAHHVLGIALFRLSRYEEARTALRKSLEIHPTYDAAIRDIGRSYELQESYRIAASYFERAYALNPICFNMIFLGKVYTKIGRKKEAEALLKEATEKYPDQFWPLVFLARFYIAERRLDEARALYEQVLRIAPRTPNALNNGAIYFHLIGDMEKARELLARALVIDPDNRSAQIRLTSVLLHTGETERAMTLSETLERRFPTDLHSLYLRTQMLLFGDELEEAQRLSAKTMSRLQESVIAVDLHGRTLLLGGRDNDAEALGREMIIRFPESPRGYNLLGASLCRQGRIDEAVELQSRAIEIAPGNPETLFCTIRAFEASGKTEEALPLKERLDWPRLREIVAHAPVGDWEHGSFWLREGFLLHP